VTFFNTKEQRDILQQYGTAFYDAILLHGVAGCHAASWCWRISRLFVQLKDATVLRGVEGYYAAPWC
jgi:hypothetical protein